MRKKKILKFHENEKALSISKMKYDHMEGRSTELMSLIGRPKTTEEFPPPLASFLIGKPTSYCPINAGVEIIHSSILINLGLPAITASDCDSQ